MERGITFAVMSTKKPPLDQITYSYDDIDPGIAKLQICALYIHVYTSQIQQGYSRLHVHMYVNMIW